MPIPRTQLVRIVSLCVIAAILMCGYALARPSIESLFLSRHGSRSLPAAWIAGAFTSAIAAALVGRFVARLPVARMLAAVALVAGVLLCVLLAATAFDVPGATFALYVWKDVYVVVLVELFWMFANVVFPITIARWTYGLFGIAGSLGGVVGNLAVGPLSKGWGTALVPWTVLPTLVLVGLAALWLAKVAGEGAARADIAERPGFMASLHVVRSSRYLGLVLALVAIVQISVALIDFEFNATIERAGLPTDQRTALIGRMYAAIDGATVILHLLTGPLLRLLGGSGVLVGLPLVLGGTLVAALVSPGPVVMAIAKVASKALDYSLFRAAKGLLYIPLPRAEKTLGKSVVDVLTYRTAKAAASLLLLGLGALAGVPALWLALASVTTWLALTLVLLPRTRPAEAAAEAAAP